LGVDAETGAEGGGATIEAEEPAEIEPEPFELLKKSMRGTCEFIVIPVISKPGDITR